MPPEARDLPPDELAFRRQVEFDPHGFVYKASNLGHDLAHSPIEGATSHVPRSGLPDV
jgi:hypothetical protein